MCKRILILKACGNSDEPHECNGICEQAHIGTGGLSYGWKIYNRQLAETRKK